MSSIVLGGLAAGLVFFVWSAISWMALPWQRAVYQHFADEDAVAEIVAKNAPASGLYGLPREPRYPAGATKQQRDEIDRTVWEKMQKGPMLTAVVTHGGFPPFPRMLVAALLTYVVTALLLGWLLAQTSGLSYVERVLFVAVAGLAAGITCRAPDRIWHQYPLNHTIVQIAHVAIGWLLGGLPLAAFVRGLHAAV